MLQSQREGSLLLVSVLAKTQVSEVPQPEWYRPESLRAGGTGTTPGREREGYSLSPILKIGEKKQKKPMTPLQGETEPKKKYPRISRTILAPQSPNSKRLQTAKLITTKPLNTTLIAPKIFTPTKTLHPPTINL